MSNFFLVIFPEIVYIACGLVSVDCAFRALKNEKSKLGTFTFWFVLGIIFIFGKLIPFAITGGLLIFLGCLTATKQVRLGTFAQISEEFKQAASEKIGNTIFVPAVLIGLVALLVSFIKFNGKSLGSAAAIGLGCLVALIVAMIITKPKLKETREDTSKFMMQVGAAAILPQLLGSLGTVFTKAGVGTIISESVSKFVPSNNIVLGVVAYCLGMVIFTMIMGNAFAAFSVITVGIGIPFVIQQGGNPAVVAALGMTCGFCGTLLTPMAANFNIVPVAVLDMQINGL